MRKKYSKKMLLKKANKAFLNGEYKKAIFYFSLVLKQEPQNKEAKIGVLLSDIALEGNDDALSLYDYYLLLKEEKNERAEKIIEDLIETTDNNIEMITNIFNDNLIELEEGISYEDFKTLIKSRGSFKRAFEDIMFSTKVIISDKRDFFDFLEALIDNGFDKMALTYLEDASMLYPSDSKIFELFEKIKPVDIHNDS